MRKRRFTVAYTAVGPGCAVTLRRDTMPHRLGSTCPQSYDATRHLVVGGAPYSHSRRFHRAVPSGPGEVERWCREGRERGEGRRPHRGSYRATPTGRRGSASDQQTCGRTSGCRVFDRSQPAGGARRRPCVVPTRTGGRPSDQARSSPDRSPTWALNIATRPAVPLSTKWRTRCSGRRHRTAVPVRRHEQRRHTSTPRWARIRRDELRAGR